MTRPRTSGPRRALLGVPLTWVVLSAVCSGAVIWLGWRLGLPLWMVVSAGLVPLVPLFTSEALRFHRQFPWLTLFYLLVVTQLGHVGEHVAQMYQIHVLGWPLPQARGIFGALDIEWVHFLWNTWVLAAVLLLLNPFPRSRWLWATVPLTCWHAIEHSYILVYYLQTGIAGTPGLLARGGVIAGGLPLARPDLHFLYNLVETVPLVVAFARQVQVPVKPTIRTGVGSQSRLSAWRWLGLGLGGVATLVAAVGPAGVGAWSQSLTNGGKIAVSLQPVGATHVPEGAPFRFLADIRNTSPGAVGAFVTFEIRETEADRSPVVFDTWMGSLPGSIGTTVKGSVVTSRWFDRQGSFLLQARWRGAPVSQPLRFVVTAPFVTIPRFENVVPSSGIQVTLPGSAGCGLNAGGAAWGDVDGTGFPDLYIPRPDAPAQLWINDGHGHFTEQAHERGVDNLGAHGIGAVFVDYDNDGNEDLFVLNANGPNRLYRNDGTGHFQDVAARVGLTGRGGVPTSAAWADYDGDGRLDLFVTDYGECPQGDLRSLRYGIGHLYHQEADTTFTDQTALLGPDATVGAGFQAAWIDYNGSGRPSLYVANDYVGPNPHRNHLWRNDGRSTDGRWRFTDVSAQAHANLAVNAMGLGVGDYRRELRLDLAVSNMGSNLLLRNDGRGTFTEVGNAARIDLPMQAEQSEVSTTWALNFYDLTLGGWEDLFVTAGGIEAADESPTPLRSELFVNARDGTFLDFSAPGHADLPGLWRGAAFADFDRDGRMGFFIVNHGGPSLLYRNVTPFNGNHWLEVRLRGVVSNRDGCGATVTLAVADGRMMRQLLCGSEGLASGNEPLLHFGLGPSAQVRSMEVGWPSGIRQVLHDVAGDRLLTLTESA